MSTLERAIVIAAEAHAGQTDKAGAPYVLHPLRVMLSLETEDAQIAGVLHDVVEDSDWDLDGLRREGFAEGIVRAIDAVTRRDGETYEEFVGRAGRDPLGRRIKLADLRDNCDPGRIPEPGEQDRRRRERYLRAIQQLTSEGPSTGSP